VIVSLIGTTRTEAGLRIKAELDSNPYEIGIKVSDEQLVAVSIERDAFHGEWNYTISPEGEAAARRKNGKARSTRPGRGHEAP
jgi:hypothetical protein